MIHFLTTPTGFWLVIVPVLIVVALAAACLIAAAIGYPDETDDVS